MSGEQKRKEPPEPDELGRLLKEAAMRRLARERLGISSLDPDFPFEGFLIDLGKRLKEN